MNILIIGSGGREHALALSLAADPSVGALHVAPGNAGTAQVATNHAVNATDAEDVVALAEQVAADLVVIGPEAPLVAGVADAVRDAGIDCFGPSGAAAELEGSKSFAKQIMAEAGVPTAMAHLCTTLDEVAHALDQFGAPYVVKDDGLAGGKGVVVTEDRQAALDHARACLARPDGAVVIEEYLDGPEVSLFAITDGRTAVPLLPAQDFKRVGEADAGPNTGGMGAYAPLPWAPDGLVEEIMERVVQPTIDAMAARGTSFSGLLYAGLALTSRGLRVVEFNARFGDPETQVVLALLRTPLAGVLVGRRPRHAGRGATPGLASGVRGHGGPGRARLPGGTDPRWRPDRCAHRLGCRVGLGRRLGRACRYRHAGWRPRGDRGARAVRHGPGSRPRRRT